MAHIDTNTSPLQSINPCAETTWRQAHKHNFLTTSYLVLAILAACISAQSEAAQSTPSSVETAMVALNAPGAEGRFVQAEVGSWVVTETVWSKPGAQPVVTGSLIAERHLVGNLLEETLHAPSNPTVLRRDFLTFDRVEGRWQYMSFDTRAAVGMMTAQSYGAEKNGNISLVFQPIAMPGSTNGVGQMLRMRQDIIRDGADHVVKNQYFTIANGVGSEWLAHRYDSVRMATQIPERSDRIEAIQQRGTLRVAVLNEYPWLKRTVDGSPEPFEGAAWLLAKAYASRLGVQLETIAVTFDDKVTILDDGRADITIAPLLQTAARERAVDLIPYSIASHCAFGRADNPKVARATTLDDLNRSDITIGYINDTPQGAWLKSRLPMAKSDGVPGSLADLATAEVIAGRADIAPIDKFFFAELAKQTPGLITVPKGDACMSSEELAIPIAMAVAKGQPSFLAWLRAVAKELKPQVEAEQTRVVSKDNTTSD